MPRLVLGVHTKIKLSREAAAAAVIAVVAVLLWCARLGAALGDDEMCNVLKLNSVGAPLHSHSSRFCNACLANCLHTGK